MLALVKNNPHRFWSYKMGKKDDEMRHRCARMISRRLSSRRPTSRSRSDAKEVAGGFFFFLAYAIQRRSKEKFIRRSSSIPPTGWAF